MRRIREQDGQSFVEFALIMPFLIFLVLAIVQFGRGFHDYITITDAARVGAREAAVHRTTACTTATAKINGMGVIPSGSTIACTAGANVGDQVSVTITSSFSVGLPGYFGVPALSQTFTIQGVAKERLE
ncbi:MAG: TadE/TadG family type IV pilus assembly protein [Gaiellaceae bacterium]